MSVRNTGFYRCISTPPPFQMDLRMKCPFVILLTKNLKHQNTPWNTLSPSPRLHKLLHGIGDTVIFLSLKPAFRHGRRILFDNTSRHHSQQGAENEVKKTYSSSNPSGNLSNCSPCRKDKQQKGTIFEGGQLVQKT